MPIVLSHTGERTPLSGASVLIEIVQSIQASLPNTLPNHLQKERP
jgi:hypothetical protein